MYGAAGSPAPSQFTSENERLRIILEMVRSLETKADKCAEQAQKLQAEIINLTRKMEVQSDETKKRNLEAHIAKLEVEKQQMQAKHNRLKKLALEVHTEFTS